MRCRGDQRQLPDHPRTGCRLIVLQDGIAGRLRKAIAEKTSLDADSICRDDRCPLGQWLHGDGGRRWGVNPGFVALLDKHAEFHSVAGQVARQITAGALDSAERLIGSGSKFAQVSTEVCTLLTRAKRGL